MTFIEKIEKAVAALSASESAEFSAWLKSFRNDLWGRRIEHGAVE